MSTPGSWRGVVQKFRHTPSEIQRYFQHLPKLAEQFPWDVCLAYLFSRVELAHSMALYCGAVKLHRVNPALARLAIENTHITRERFGELFTAVFRQPLKKDVTDLIGEAQEVRNRIMHGKAVTEGNKRKATVDVLRYGRAFNDSVDQMAGLRPFGDLRGFKGRATALDKPTSRWVLKGIGFTLA